MKLPPLCLRKNLYLRFLQACLPNQSQFLNNQQKNRLLPQHHQSPQFLHGRLLLHTVV